MIGVALAAPLIVAALNFVHGTDLHNHDVSTAPGMHLAPSALPQLLLPYIYGPIFGAIYPQPQLVSSWSSVGGFLTTSLVMFGLLGLVSTGRRGLRIMLAVWIAVSLLLMYAHVAPLTDAVRALPGMSRVIIFRFEFAPLEFAVIVLAALGLDAALHHPARRRVLAAVAATLVLVAGAAVGSHHLAAIAGVASSAKPYWLVPVVWGAGIVIAAAAGVLVRRPAVRAALLAAWSPSTPSSSSPSHSSRPPAPWLWIFSLSAISRRTPGSRASSASAPWRRTTGRTSPWRH